MTKSTSALNISAEEGTKDAVEQTVPSEVSDGRGNIHDEDGTTVDTSSNSTAGPADGCQETSAPSEAAKETEKECGDLNQRNSIKIWWDELTKSKHGCYDAEIAVAPKENDDSDPERRNSVEIWWRDMTRKKNANNAVDVLFDEDRHKGTNEKSGVGNWWKSTTQGWAVRSNDDGNNEDVSDNNSNETRVRRSTLASFLVPEEILSSVDILNATLRDCDNHGIVDVMNLYPKMRVFQSIYLLAKLQRVSSLDRNMVSGGGKSMGSEPPDDLLSELAHYAPFASAVYGWKFQLVTGGKLIRGDVPALVAKTGVEENDVVAARWKAEPHRPAFFLLRDHGRRSIVLCIRGTCTMKDVLTDLFFHEDHALQDEGDHDVFLSKMGQGQKVTANATQTELNVRAHEGMVNSAREIAREMRVTVEAEMVSHEGYRLVLCGHSMGGGAAAILGSFWRNVFPNVVVYVFGCPCVSPLDSKPAREDNVYSIVREGDPFSTLSLGHVADISKAIAQLCEDDDLRSQAIQRIQQKAIEGLSPEDIEWCCQTMGKLRENFNAEKFYPSGQVYLLTGKDLDSVSLGRVEPEIFGEMTLHKTDLTRHYFSNYESALLKLWRDRERGA